MDLYNQQASESMFMKLLEAAPDAMVITNSKGIILLVNAQTENLFGYNRKEIVGKEVEILMPERFHQRHLYHTKEYMAKPKVRAMGVGMDLFGKRKDGSEFPVSISLSPINNLFEDELVVMSAIRDISRQKETEAEIMMLNKNLESLVVKRTEELQTALNNEKAARMEYKHNEERLAFLYKAGEMLNSSLDYSQTLANIAKMITPQIADWCIIDEIQEEGTLKHTVVSHTDPVKAKRGLELVEKYQQDSKSMKGISQVYNTLKSEMYEIITDEMLLSEAQDQSHFMLLREIGIKSVILVPLHLRNKTYGVLTLGMSDLGRQFNTKDLEITEVLARRITIALENAKIYKDSQSINALLEQQVSLRTQELEAINKELEAFSYSVSHDLRAPLRSIDGFSNLILRDYSKVLDDQGKDFFRRVQDASQHMGNLIDDLLKLARISRVEMNLELTNLSQMVETIAEELKISDPNREIDFLIQESVLAYVDNHLIQIVFRNLLGNAWKYSKNNPHAILEFGTSPEGSETVYFIRDNGVGFDMKYVDKLFGAFQRLHSIKDFEGNGIGLATVQRIIRRHNGRIWAVGEIDKGATFFFTLNM